MQFNEDAVRAFLIKRTLPDCEVCHNNDWGYTLDVMELRPFKIGVTPTGGGVMPLLATFCNKCNNVRTFTAIGARLIDTAGNVLDAAGNVAVRTVDG